MNVFENPYVRVTFNEEKKRLYQDWEGFALSEEFRKGIDQSVDFMEKNQVNTVLSDTVKQRVVKPEDGDYANAALKTMFSNGMQAMAFVMSENIFHKLSLEHFRKQVGSNNVKFFKSRAEAEKWLDQY